MNSGRFGGSAVICLGRRRRRAQREFFKDSDFLGTWNPNAQIFAPQGREKVSFSRKILQIIAKDRERSRNIAKYRGDDIVKNFVQRRDVIRVGASDPAKSPTRSSPRLNKAQPPAAAPAAAKASAAKPAKSGAKPRLKGIAMWNPLEITVRRSASYDMTRGCCISTG